MWRDWTTHQHKETVFLTEVMDEVLADRQINDQVSAVLEKTRAEKTLARLFSSLASGHIRLMLGFLYAVVNGKIHLSDIEELKRDKIFFGETDEVEETMKEKVASLEVFILAHDLGKLETEYSYAHQIVKKEYREVLQRMTEEFRLSPEDAEDVFHLIILHEKIIHNFFFEPSRPTYEYLVKYCEKYGRDADDFLDLLLAAVFLDAVIGAKLDPKVFFNFLSAERLHTPERSVSRLQQQAEKKKKAERIRLREAGLDGNELMKLFGMKPGPEFGKMLAAIHAFARGEAVFPEVPDGVRVELLNRVQRFKTPTLAPSPVAGRDLD